MFSTIKTVRNHASRKYYLEIVKYLIEKSWGHNLPSAVKWATRKKFENIRNMDDADKYTNTSHPMMTIPPHHIIHIGKQLA